MAEVWLSDKWQEEMMNMRESPEVKQAMEGMKDVELSMVMHIQPHPQVGLDEDLYMLMGFNKGDMSYGLINQSETDKASIMMGLSYETMKGMNKGTVNMQTAFMQGQVKLEKGDMSGMMKYAGQMQGMMGMQQKMGEMTIWPDDLPANELEEYKTMLKGRIETLKSSGTQSA